MKTSKPVVELPLPSSGAVVMSPSTRMSFATVTRVNSTSSLILQSNPRKNESNERFKKERVLSNSVDHKKITNGVVRSGGSQPSIKTEVKILIL